MKEYAFGVDVGGTTVKIGLFRTNGELIEKWEIPTRTEQDGSYILKDIADSVDGKLAARGISKERVEGIGIGIPGPVDPNGTVLRCINLGWGIFNVEEKLSELTGLKIKAGNDANVAALGEMWQGGGKGYRNLVMVTLGTGVGGGVIVDGKILPGYTGAAGEIGHIPVKDDDLEYCGCGKRGCLEQYASAKGIVRITRRYLAAHPETVTCLKNGEELTSKIIFDEAKQGDETALSMVREVGSLLGKAMASIACIMNPEAFVIGGGMSNAGSILIEEIRKEFCHYAFHASRDTVLKLAELGNDAGIYGGVKLVLP